MFRAVLAIVCAVTASAQTPMRRQGPYWIHTETIRVSTPAKSRLQISTRGAVTLTGGTSAGTVVSCTHRVRARSEAEARALLKQLTLSGKSAGDVTTIRLAGAAQPNISTDMTVMSRSDVAHVLVETQGGDVAVKNFSARVDVESGGGPISIDDIRGDAFTRTAGGDITLGSVSGVIRCFSGGGGIHALRAGGESWLETAGGNILVDEATGPVSASTAGGNIRIGTAGSWVSARTAGGRIDVDQARGVVIAGNSSGSIQIGASGGVRLESNGGSIRLRGSAGALRAVTDVGSILAELMPGHAIQDSVLSTGAGDITVYIPSNLALTIRALNESGRPGRIISEFAEIPVRQSPQPSRSAFLAEGELNGGGPVLRLTSTGGTIYLKRQR